MQRRKFVVGLGSLAAGGRLQWVQVRLPACSQIAD